MDKYFRRPYIFYSDLASLFSNTYIEIFDYSYILIISLGLLSTFARYKYNFKKIKKRVIIFDSISILYTFYVFKLFFFFFQEENTSFNSEWLVLAIILSFLRDSPKQES